MSDPTTHVSAKLAPEAFKTVLSAGRHSLVADEPVAAGGADAGPSPFAFLLSGLTACTAITLRMYAERKGWTLKAVTVDATFHHDKAAPFIDRVLRIEGDLNAEQIARLADIAERTPVTLAVKGGTDVRTRLHEAAAR
jgi:putative redox protein